MGPRRWRGSNYGSLTISITTPARQSTAGEGGFAPTNFLETGIVNLHPTLHPDGDTYPPRNPGTSSPLFTRPYTKKNEESAGI
ncbi:hypothetical protein CC2G_001469 [Coprinopsis cinerea AmutBmut pab1-1]|nr:hypothetical protein CC2G_001469 [Coprinopsis cinerea AmutBmut pab1-1]